jgi:hypothetical protein
MSLHPNHPEPLELQHAAGRRAVLWRFVEQLICFSSRWRMSRGGRRSTGRSPIPKPYSFTDCHPASRYELLHCFGSDCRIASNCRRSCRIDGPFRPYFCSHSFSSLFTQSSCLILPHLPSAIQIRAFSDDALARDPTRSMEVRLGRHECAITYMLRASSLSLRQFGYCTRRFLHTIADPSGPVGAGDHVDANR